VSPVGEIAAAQAFSAHAGEYTATRRRLVPDFDRFYATAVEAVSLVHPPDAPLRVLDLGAGTGLLSARLLDAFPYARLELLDGSEPMLDEARGRLGAAVRVVHVADLADELPAGPFDALVSALAIHQLADADKRALFARARRRLTPGGVFVNAEQLQGPTPGLQRAYTARWEADCRALGASEPELAGARERMALDRCASLGDQLSWLGEAGFPSVDCLYKRWRFAVYAGFTGAMPPRATVRGS
jgi:tRNA (cmo5U34)-methyltransferase